MILAENEERALKRLRDIQLLISAFMTMNETGRL